jgi:hypothetical protein
VDEAPSSSRIPIVAAGRASIADVEQARPPVSSGRGSIPDVEHVIPEQRPSDGHMVTAPPPAPTSAPPVISLPPGAVSSAPPWSPSPPPEKRISSPIPASPRASLAPDQSSPAFAGTAELRLELAALSARLGGTHYEVLGVPADAAASAIQNAFFTLAKKWHPDRLRPEVGDLKDQAARIFSRLSEASQVLSDASLRQAYDQSLVTGDTVDEAAQVQKVLKATNAFQKAEVLLKRGNLALAEKEALIAFENDPTQADHVALYVWIQAQNPNADLVALAVRLEKAAKTEPNNLRVRWYRGQLLKRLGRMREALHDFRFIVERDPRHTDAHREVRLYAMRRGNKPSDPPGHTPSQPAGPDSQGSGKSLPPKAPPSARPSLLTKFFKKPP